MRWIQLSIAGLLLFSLLPGTPAHAEESDPATQAKLVDELRAQAREALDVLEADTSIQALRSLGRLRDELDRRRENLLVALFHPLDLASRAPSTPAARILAKIVARRTAALEEVWNDARAVELSPDATAQHANLLKTLLKLEALGDPAPRLRQAAAHLPAHANRMGVTIRTYARTPEERTAQLYDAWVVDSYNAARSLELDTDAYELARVTNRHRRMVGHTASVQGVIPIRDDMDEPAILAALRAATVVKSTSIRALRIDKRLVAAAEGHAGAMAEGQFFAHTTPSRFTTHSGRSPGDRVRRAGYKASGVSENLGAGAMQAKRALVMWLRSPAQHRNLLGAWSDVGAAQTGGRWVVNFAAGDGGPMTRQSDLKPRRGK